MRTPTVRPALEEDVERITELWNLCLPYDAIEPSTLKAFFESPHYQREGVLVSKAAEGLTGFVMGIADGETGWIPIFFFRGVPAGDETADLLLAGLSDYFRARGVKYVKAEPFRWEVRFSTGIDDRYTEILRALARNGFGITDRSQVDIVKDLADFQVPPQVVSTKESLESDGFSFDFCQPRHRQQYLAFMEEHFGGYGSWCKASREYVESDGDPRLRVLAFHRDRIVGFCAVDKEHDWYIWATGVREDLRLKGIGTVLVFLAIEDIKRRGVDRMCVSDCPVEFYKVVEGEIVRHYVMMGRPL
ncbi:MAG: GNAT family N-acetyltransferase [Planctomycetota bacterium]|jgi:ribosomal protein S18 acetylase RimI-like enzyme